MSKPAGGPNMS